MNKLTTTLILAATIVATPAFAATSDATCQGCNQNDHTQGIVVENGSPHGSRTITVPLTITVEPNGSISGASIDEPADGYDGIKVDLTLPPVVPAPKQQ